MDRVYTNQRHIYDLTRRYYLLGRDRLIQDLHPPPGGLVLEIGCGTARNLVAIARLYPGAACYGIDVSAAMLATARRAVARAGVGQRIQLAEGDATAFDPAALFGAPLFERIVISYALSMIPRWQEVLRHAASMLAPCGSLHIVDFGDQRGLPAPFKTLLEAWLARFHVTPRSALGDEVARIADAHGLNATTRMRYRGYAISAELVRDNSSASR